MMICWSTPIKKGIGYRDVQQDNFDLSIAFLVKSAELKILFKCFKSCMQKCHYANEEENFQDKVAQH